MALITSQQIANYFELYHAKDVTFTKEVTRAVGLRTEQTFIRCLGYQWACIIYSTSMVGAKVVVNVKSDLRAKIRQAHNLVSLRFCFDRTDKPDPMAFYVASRVEGYTPSSEKHPELNFVSLKYTQRPSDDLIGILGTLLETNINSKKRREERIDINADTLRKLGFKGREARLLYGAVQMKCIIKDLSFSGARLVFSCPNTDLLHKKIILKLEVEFEKESYAIEGEIIRTDEIGEKREICVAGIKFNEKSVPMEYKMRLNEYFTSIRKHS